MNRDTQGDTGDRAAKTPGVMRSTAIVSACTGISRGLGFLREVLMAVFFGTSLAKSAFDVAFRIPNLFRRLFGEGALAAAFVPAFTESLEKEGVEEANRLAGAMMTMLGTSLAVLVVGGVLLASASMSFMSLGAKAAAVLPLLRIMLPYMFFICLVALCMAILNSFHHFALPALTPVLLNVIWIVTLIFICPRFGGSASERIYGAAWGILAAGALQLAIQVPALLHFGVRPRLCFAWRDPKVTGVLLRMGPAAVGMGIHQVNVCIDGLLALAAAPWAPAALTYSERLIYLPLGIFATALGTVLLPTFSRQAARGSEADISETMRQAACNLMLVMVPAAVGLFVLAAPVVRLAFQWQGGLFDAASTARTARALRFYAPGLIVFSLYKILVPAFYALKDTRTPVRVGIHVVGLNLMLNVLFVLTWPIEYKHAGLALATVLASTVNCFVLARLLSRRIGSPNWRLIGNRACRTLAASAVMGVAALMAHSRLASMAPASKWGELLAVGGGIVVGVCVYVALAALLCRDELKAVAGRRGRRNPQG